VYVILNSRGERGLKKAKCPKFKIKIICDDDNFETVRERDRMSVVLITDMKSHTGFRLVPTSVTLNDLERRSIALILRYFTE